MVKKSKRSNRDHAHKQQCFGRSNEAIAEQLQALLTPAVNNQQLYFRQLGLRNRILNLSLMLAAVLTMLWRQVPSVQELTRMLTREDLLWCKATVVSQQALSQRFLSFPAALFEQVFMELLPQFKQRWAQRQDRPLPASVECAYKQFDHIWIADSSTLEALFLKLKSLQDKATGTLAGKMGTVVDLVTRLPVQIWFEQNPKASDTRFEDDLLALVAAKTLLIIDRGFYHFLFWSQLQQKEVDIICRLQAGADYTVERTFTERAQVRDQLIRLGVKRKGSPSVADALGTSKIWLRLVQLCNFSRGA